MREGLKKVKSAFLFAQDGIRRFAYTDLYILLVLAIVVTAWTVRNATFGFVALILVSSVVLIFSDDILPLLVNAFGAMLMIYKDKVDEFAYLWPSFIPLVIAIAVFVVRNSIAKVRQKQKFVLGKMFFPQIAVSMALLLGGVGVIAKENYLTALPNVLALGIGVLAVYLLFANFIKKDEKIDYAKYFAKVVMWIGFAVCVEMIAIIARSGLSPRQWASAYWNVGWGNRNNIATFLLFSAPMALYLSTRTKRGWAYILMAFLQYFCLCMTLSRGGILCGFIALIFGVAFSIYKAPDRKRQTIYFAVCLGVAAILCVIGRDVVKGLISSLGDRIHVGDGDMTSGRSDLYKEAWEVFKKHPFLGAGMGYVGYGPGMFNDMKQYWFHSTLFQVLGCMGIVGIAAYVYYYVVRLGFCIKMMAKQFKFAFFVFVAWVGFEGYSMIDTGTMIPFPNMMLVAVMTYIVEISCTTKKHEGEIDGISECLMNERYIRETSTEIVRVKNID